jgi:S-adenosylmethionine:tRNA ribosyltransferase-isomerase
MMPLLAQTETNSFRPPLDALSFPLPSALEARQPPEARGLARDEVRLMVSYAADDRVMHSIFRDLPCFLARGDVLVINTSKTLAASLPAKWADGTQVRLHLSTQLPAGLWAVEVRRLTEGGTKPYLADFSGETIHLPGGGRAMIQAAYGRGPAQSTRLWIASLKLPADLPDYLATFGQPIRYNYVPKAWPLADYQTVFAREPGSAEMPSAGRPFTAELITRLVARGVQVVPLVLHTGVSSQEAHEPPYAEFYRVPLVTTEVVNAARAAQRRVIAVGTTVVRALETVADTTGRVHPGEGWTDLVITPQRGVHVVDGLITGLHEPQASHLAMLAALAGRDHLRVAYHEALKEKYLWHEFGDSHLILT